MRSRFIPSIEHQYNILLLYSRTSVSHKYKIHPHIKPVHSARAPIRPSTAQPTPTSCTQHCGFADTNPLAQEPPTPNCVYQSTYIVRSVETRRLVWFAVANNGFWMASAANKLRLIADNASYRRCNSAVADIDVGVGFWLTLVLGVSIVFGLW